VFYRENNSEHFSLRRTDTLPLHFTQGRCAKSEVKGKNAINLNSIKGNPAGGIEYW
jgi:hypothetical protein